MNLLELCKLAFAAPGIFGSIWNGGCGEILIDCHWLTSIVNEEGSFYKKKEKEWSYFERIFKDPCPGMDLKKKKDFFKKDPCRRLDGAS